MFKTKDITCCSAFKSLLGKAGQKGLAIIVADHGELSFRLQSRAVAHSLRGKVSVSSDSPDVIINLSQSVTVQHCPFCGKKLSKLVKRAPLYYRTLAEDHTGLDDNVLG